MKIPKHIFAKPAALTAVSDENKDALLRQAAEKTSDAALGLLKSRTSGLTASEARRRLRQHGLNIVVKEKRRHWFFKLLKNFREPLSLLLLAFALIAYFTRDFRAGIMISVMILLSVFLKFFQELKADKAAEKLKAMVRTTATVVRRGQTKEIPLRFLAPGDIVRLSAGDMVPADIRLLSAKDLFVNQATLTGESMPMEKFSEPASHKNILEISNLCFLGSNIESGSAIALVLATGQNTRLGQLARELAGRRPLTTFEIGIKKVTWLIIKIILIMAPAVFLLNGLSKGDWFESLLFALAVAIGLAPEMLPAILAVNLAKGAVSMSKKKVIVKHLEAIQNFGAMEILCTDKTGTLTEGRVVLEKHLDIDGQEREKILDFAYLNSFYQTGLKNLMDAAVLKHGDKKIGKEYKKIDEIPFDFARRRMSVVVEDKSGQHILICKGAVEETLALCRQAEEGERLTGLEKIHHQKKDALIKELNNDGFRVVAVAYKILPLKKTNYEIKDESEMTLLGFLAFLDPPKASAKTALAELAAAGVAVKVLTGDNETVTEKICREVGFPSGKILLGEDLDKLSGEALKEAVEKTSVFAKLDPGHKEKIIELLRQNGRSVGFLGDGINDAPALRGADVGISVDTAADIAKESSDIILLEKNLAVLKDGVIEGRRIFSNVVKYIEMSNSSNFGNMFSVVAASFFLPFLPMMPIQILVNNLLYDLSQTAIPTDRVDEEFLRRPRRWEIGQIKKFILYIGPISSLFDFATYFLMLFVFNAWANPALFQTGWFVESLITQTLIIHIIRTNKIPFIQSRASPALTFTTLLIAAAGVYLPFSPLAETLGFTALPALYWPILFAMIIAYFILTQLAKKYFLRRHAV